MIKDPVYWFVILVFFLVLTLSQEESKGTEITCTENHSQLYGQGGWKKIETVDYYRISVLVGKGKAKVECWPATLMCTVFVEGKAYPETKGCLWFWKELR